jgi:predicted Zn-dependent peptidase
MVKLELGNGLRIILNKRASKTVSITMLVRCGAIDEGEENSGIAHFIEHLLFRRSSDIERLGGSSDAYTYRIHTRYSINLPSKFLSDGLRIMHNSIFSPGFDNKTIENERLVILNELKQETEDNPFNYGYIRFEEALKGKTSLGRPVLGNRENIMGLSMEAISNFYKKHYIPNNMVLSIAGGFNVEKCKRLIENVFTGEKRGDKPQFSDLAFLVTSKREHRFRKNGIHQAYIMVGGRAPVFFDKKRYAMSLVAAILGEGMLSRLYKKLVEELGLAYSVYTYYAQEGHHITTVSSSPNNIDKILEILTSELEYMRNGITGEELNFAKNYVKGRKAIMMESNQNAADHYGFLELFSLGEPSFDKKIGAVTIDEVNAIVGEYLNTDNTIFVVVSEE